MTLQLNSEYRGVKIYHQNEDPEKVEEVLALDKKNKVELEIDSTGALFVVPLKLNEK